MMTLLVTGFVFFGYNDRIIKDYDSFRSLNKGWTITDPQGNSFVKSLDSAHIGVVSEGETIVLQRTLEDLHIYHPCMSYFSIQAMVNVYLDDKLIYTFGYDFYENNTTVPKKINVFPLGDRYIGKELRIEVTGSKYNSFSGVSPVYVGTRPDLVAFRAVNFRTSFFSGIFLVCLGMVLIVSSPYLFIYHNKDTRILFSGLISLVLGVYILAYYGIIDALLNKPVLNTICEYTSLYNVPTAFAGYLMSSYTGKAKRIFRGLFITDVVMFLMSILLHIIHIRRFSDYTFFLHSIAGIEGLVAAVLIIHFYRIDRKTRGIRNMSADNVFLLGILIFMACSVFDVLRYNYMTYISYEGEAYVNIDGTTIGSLILMACLLISYLFFNIYSTNYDSMQSRIANLAYTDPLTGLANRARCEQMMATLSQEHTTYVIISLDLNKLKEVNDSLGHYEGDRLLTGFATILSDCFWDASLIGRMGGDEFIVIMLEDKVFNATRRIHEFYSLINEWNHKETNFSYSASYGYAYSYEVPNGSAQEVYMLADNRMYEMKREHHSKAREGVT
jgi:diguanylate cyclase (GGDEF)-like protein